MGDYGPAVTSVHSRHAGSPPPPSQSSNEVSVLITGFGPFKINLVNASYLIATSLPPSFTFPAPDDVSHTRRVSLHVHPSPIPVSYNTVRQLLPAILAEYASTHGGRRPDLVIHLGIASPRLYYSVEIQAHRDDYNITDIEGRSGFDDGEKRWKEMGLPAILKPGPAPDTPVSAASPYPPNDHFLDTWKLFAPATSDLRISEDAGHYLCDFIYYTSLSLAMLDAQDRGVLFLHVPGACEDKDIERGRNITLALVKTMIQCWIDEKHLPDTLVE